MKRLPSCDCNWCRDPGWQFWHCPRCGAELPEDKWAQLALCWQCETALLPLSVTGTDW